ncbi:PREDICTED: transcription termination factor 2 [Rhagoletis zephyria]|uniref:transcription termination factor 2 n=1 Tax=Rhagoletis zephyria TaxID=28612 RepID=UPI0008113BFE|nr:PREDICTED: transcription termination factor 2 [Rhagoletis zephyria]
MSDSDELKSSDQDKDFVNDVSYNKDDLLSGELIIEESENESSEESIIIRKRSSNGSKKTRAVIPSESEEDDDEFERRALSPRTRMSITGVRPSDLSDSSEIEYSDTKSEIAGVSPERCGKVQDLEKTTFQDKTIYFRTPSTENKNSFLHRSVSEQNVKEYYVGEMEKSDSYVCESSPEITETTKAPDPISATPINHRIERFGAGAESPLSSARYSIQFEKAIKDKLSSTMYQPSLNDTYRSQGDASDESDVQVISLKEKAIEIGSSSDESNAENLLPEVNMPNYKKAELVRPSPYLWQPNILTKLDANHAVGSTVKSKDTTSPKQLVSKEYFDKELKKLQELKIELQSAEKLLEKISSSLPDGGWQLSLRIERLRNDVHIKSQYLSTLKIEDDGISSSSQPEVQHQKDPLSWEDLSKAVNQMQPTHTGKQGLATFNAQRELTVECLKDIHSSLKTCPAENVLADDPIGLRINLMDHQKHALAWMTWRENQKPRGGILADDMGLGKTLTMISLVLASKHCSEAEEANESDEASDSEKENRGWTSKGRRDFYPGGTLVICPASLVRQWEAEVDSKVKRHKLTVCVHHGNNRDTKPKHLRTYDIVVTTYNIVSREQKSQGALFGIKWQRIILDEAHVVRNHKAQMSIAVCALRGKYKWALTGTPIQNKEMDAYALIKFLRCSPFDELPHWKKWIDNKSAGGQQRLNALMKTLMLRRTKVMLQERGALQCLPEKSTELIEVYLDKDEMNVYQKIMVYSRTLFAQFLLQRAERNTDYMYKEDSNRPTIVQTKDPNGAYYKVHEKFTKLHRGQKDVKSHEILVLLLRLRQICCHPGLIDSMLDDSDSPENTEGDSEDEKLKIDLLEQLNKLAINDSSENRSLEGDEGLKPEEEVIAKASAKVLQRNNPVFNINRPSSKIKKVLEILKEHVLNRDDKAIIVSQWTSVLNILKTHLQQQGIRTLSLNGTIPVKNRQGIVTEFNNANNDKRILLLSLTAGGVGLNLVGANHLLMIDLHWNPQLEAQAQDRIYRVGQKKNVVIYKFMCKDTVEERIRALQEHKMSIADGVLTGARSSEGSKLTMEDLRGLFGM